MRKNRDAPPNRDDHEAIEPLPPYPQLDLERYRPMLDGYDLTEDQKDAHLKAVWHIMCAFVDRAFDQPNFLDPFKADEFDKSPGDEGASTAKT